MNFGETIKSFPVWSRRNKIPERERVIEFLEGRDTFRDGGSFGGTTYELNESDSLLPFYNRVAADFKVNFNALYVPLTKDELIVVKVPDHQRGTITWDPFQLKNTYKAWIDKISLSMLPDRDSNFENESDLLVVDQMNEMLAQG